MQTADQSRWGGNRTKAS